jgi:hypothetical protein
MKFKLIAILAGFLIAMSGAVSAQDGPDTSPGVARISLIHGDVSTQRGDTSEWSAASLNQPVVAGDRISTGDRSRTEVQLDYANILRLDERAQANVVGLTRNQIQIQLGQGLAHYTVYKNGEADAEIDTPNVAIHPDRRGGSYRIYVAGDGRTEVTVRNGSVEISTPQGSTRVEKGEIITIEGTGDQTEYKIADAPNRDAFDRWNSDRDNMIRNAQAWKHTNNYYTGAEDLDAYGRWTTVPDYGPVWIPTVGPGWAPYRAGQWVWEPGWGWTWVSYEPWGWAPYHYGRWMSVGGLWGWWPGPVYTNPYYYPVWAPAYVSFFGFGSGWGVGFGFGGGWGSIGWLPVGPCDRFYPWWGGYRTRYNVVNITNITNIYNGRGGWGPLHGGTMYSNIRHAINDPGFRRSLSTVPANQFGHGRVTVRPVSHEMFRNAHFVDGNLPVVPTRRSLQISGRPAARSTISNRVQNERFFSNTRRPVTSPVSFAHEQAQMQNSIRQNSRFTPINGNQVARGNQRSFANEGNSRSGSAPRPGVNSNGSNAATPGWHRFESNGQKAPAGNTPSRSFSNRSAEPAGRSTGNSNWNSVPRPGNNSSRAVAAPREATNNGGGWQRFSQAPSRPASGQSMSRAPQNESWRSNRSSAPESRSYGNYSRPPLNMRQPIVTPRGGDYSRPSNSQPSYSRPSYGGDRGGYSAPSRGSYSAPSRGGYSAPSRGGSAPSRGGSAPSRGGGSPSHGNSGGHHGR